MSDFPFWLRYLPPSVREKVAHRPNLLNIIDNAGWLFLDKILRMGLGLLVGVWVARYLGPEQFGLFNYATAIIAIFSAVATLGLNNIAVRDLVKSPEDASAVMGTTFLLQLMGGGVAFVLAVIAVSCMRPGDESARAIVAVVGFSLVFKSTDVIRYWFESKVQSKYVVWLENLTFLFLCAVRVALILTAAPLMAFVWAVLAEAILVAILLLAIYRRQGNQIGAWNYQYARAKVLLADSWPLILSGFAAMLYMRIDQIMLGQLMGDEAVGVYSAAVRLSEVWYFIPIAISASVFPAIIEAKRESSELYHHRLNRLFELFAFLALALALPITFMADWIMGVLYGGGFSSSAQILVIHIWTGVFVFSGVASSRWFISENLQKYTFYRALAGCVVSIILNLALIPRYGPVGAAWASVVSQAVASVFFNALSRKTRPLFFMQVRAISGARYFKKLYER